MRNNHRAKKLATRATAMGLTLVMVISLLGTLSFDASAVASLSGIEKIKTDVGRLNILEIVPQEGSGSIGYYVDDQEPTRDWRNQLADNTTANMVGTAARLEYINGTASTKGLFQKLQERGLMSPDTNADYATIYPLTYKGAYVEYKPWNIPEEIDSNALTVLKLAQAEEQNVTGEIQKCEDGETGDYVRDDTYVYDPTGPADEVKFVENVAQYFYGTRSGEAAAYYYHVDFERLRLVDPIPGEELGPGEIDIKDYLKDHPEVPLYTKVEDSLVPGYVYAGTLKKTGNTFILDDEINEDPDGGYFIAKPDYTTISRNNREVVLPIVVPTVEVEGKNVVHPKLVGQTIYVADTTVAGGYMPILVSEGFEPDATKQYFAQDIMLPITVPTIEGGTTVAQTLVGQTIYVDDPTAESGYRAIVVGANFEPYPNEDPTLNAQYYTHIKTHSYFAITVAGTPFREANPGEVPFFRQEIGFLYLGNGKGDYSFEYNPGGTVEQIIKYDSVHFTGGYTNNEWFKRYVLDMEDGFDGFDITVNSVTPDQLSTVDVSNCDLVVVSAGFDLSSGNRVRYTADIKKDIFDAIVQKPRVVDTNIDVTALPGSANLAQLIKEKPAPFVLTENGKDVYYFDDTTVKNNPDPVVSLATNQFHTAIVGADSSNSAYKDVADEIIYANQIRDREDYLITDVSMASCFRYVINTHRIVNKKTSLKVLDIQPAPFYDETTDENNDAGPLTVATVLSWLPASMQGQLAERDNDNKIIGHRITITHMSTAALVGKIEDITEQYDLIYIGAAVGDDMEYVDSHLDDDFHYANIGKRKPSRDYIKGLLQTNDTHVRYSGNDLTLKKRNELKSFALAKLPIVMADELVNGGIAVQPTEHQLTVKLTPVGSNRIKAEPVIDLPETDYTATYDWKCWRYTSYGMMGGRWTEVNFDAAEAEIEAEDGLRYACTVTVTPKKAGKYGKATSKTIEFDAGMAGVGGKITQASNTYWRRLGNNNGSNNPFEGMEDVSKRDPNEGIVAVDYYVRSSFSHINSNDYKPTYQWYQGNVPSSGSSFNNPINTNNGKSAEFKFPEADKKYYCAITLTNKYNSNTKYTVLSPNYTWTKPTNGTEGKLNNVSGQSGTPGKVLIYVSAGGTSAITLDDKKIDPNSQMYAALNEVWNNENVNIFSDLELMPGLVTDDNAKKLVNALNLSRPAIDLSSQPASYNESILTNGITNPNDYKGDLEFVFQIENITDPDPANTRYECKLYIDQNGDGSYSKDELIPGITIESIKNNTTKRVTNGTLQADEDISYKVSRSLNTSESKQFAGIAAWKLAVVKVGDEAVHASQKGYAYIQPSTRTVLNVLQIKSSEHHYSTSMVDLSTPANDNWETSNTVGLTQFQTLYKQLYDAGMYDITVRSMEVKDLNYDSSGNPRTQKDIFDNVLNKYHMVIIGFEDTYDRLETPAANAVVEYIGTGKSLLFTHDTTSYWNDPEYDPADTGRTDNNDPHGRKGWGFWFNQIIRDEVGLDRYGATNYDYGGKKVTQTKKNGKTVYESDYGLLTNGSDGQINTTSAVTIDQLEKAGYTVAYVPGEERNGVGYSARETQGYTNSIIDRNTTDNSDTGNKTTKEVSQVNQGQITEYPYKLDKTMPIAETHSQYYQLNMNPKEKDVDVVVWYCLGGDNFADEKNDVTNAYYIYNRGNITYSGAGHSTTLGSSNSIAEYKLFVNTMIAAYRAGNSAPEVSFRTASDDPASTLLFPVQTSTYVDADNKTKTKTESLGGEQDMYFKVLDRNLTDDKTISVELYYEVAANADGTTPTGAVRADELAETLDIDDMKDIPGNPYLKRVDSLGTIYRADNISTASASALSSDVLYKTVIPPSLLQAFAGQQGDGKIYLVATTAIHSDAGDVPYRSFDVLTLKKLGLLRLE